MLARPVHALLLLALWAWGFALSSALAAPEKRVALVIGNGGYTAVPHLPNPPSDANEIARVLREDAFNSVTLIQDVSREKLVNALRKFAAEAEGADWAVIYYAGHGIEMAGMNYIIPVDAHLATDRDLQFEAVPMSQVLTSVEGARKLRLIILDACRDNPFASQMTRTIATRSIGRGLAQIEPEGGTLVAYAAKHGQVAQDGDAGHSPFVTSLVKHIATPGLEINRLFRRVRSDVLTVTHNRQEPFIYGSLPDEDFYFRPPSAMPANGAPAVSKVAPAAEPAVATLPAAPAAVEPTKPLVPAAEPPKAASIEVPAANPVGEKPLPAPASVEQPKPVPSAPTRVKHTSPKVKPKSVASLAPPKVEPAPRVVPRPILKPKPAPEREVSRPKQVIQRAAVEEHPVRSVARPHEFNSSRQRARRSSCFEINGHTVCE